MILGTPTTPGTYTFTVRIVALAGGPDGYQRFSITIGSGGSDTLEISRAAWVTKFVYLQVAGFDVNVGATYTVYNTSTGARLGTLGEVNSGDGQPFDGDGGLIANIHSVTRPETGHRHRLRRQLRHRARDIVKPY